MVIGHTSKIVRKEIGATLNEGFLVDWGSTLAVPIN